MEVSGFPAVPNHLFRCGLVNGSQLVASSLQQAASEHWVSAQSYLAQFEGSMIFNEG